VPNITTFSCLHDFKDFILQFSKVPALRPGFLKVNCKGKGKGKGKVVPVFNETPRRRIGEWRYSSTHSWPRH